jgi:hypothetical protein
VLTIKNDCTLSILKEWQKDFDSALKNTGSLDPGNRSVLDAILYAIEHKVIRYDLITYIAEQVNLHRKDENIYRHLPGIDRTALLALKSEFEYVLKHELQGEVEEISGEDGVLLLSLKDRFE